MLLLTGRWRYIDPGQREILTMLLQCLKSFFIIFSLSGSAKLHFFFRCPAVL
jgi:hypothetical protein